MSKGILLGHGISKEGMHIDERKVSIIKANFLPKTTKKLGKFTSQDNWHDRYLRYMAFDALDKVSKEQCQN